MDKDANDNATDAGGHQFLAKAEVMAEALPFMRRYSGHRVVVKCGGNAMAEAATLDSFARDMLLLHQVGTRPVVVHGGGPQIDAALEKAGIKPEFLGGLRVTTREVMAVVEMVLAGTINKSIAEAITRAGGTAVGISGKDGGLLRAEKIKAGAGGDLGFVANPAAVNPAVIEALIEKNMIPVIAPVASDGRDTYNINADTAAGAVAAALRATRMLMLTDVAGVLDGKGRLIPEIGITEARAMIKDGTITGGMIPKVETCINAVLGGAGGAVILDGRAKHAVLVELFTEHGIGTIIKKD